MDDTREIKIAKLEDLWFALQIAWDRDTAKGDWDSLIPSKNQCAVTALVIQDYFGGKLLRCLMSNGDSHYWNLVGNIELDLTAQQFLYMKDYPIKSETVERDRDYVLSFPDTKCRYEILSGKVDMIVKSLYKEMERLLKG